MMKHPTISPRLRKARILSKIFHPITLGGPASKTYANGFLAVGDAASQVKPTTGGGVVFGMTCSKVAAQVAREALRRNDVSEGFLVAYQNECRRLLGFDARFMLKVRRMLNTLSDAKVDRMLDFCSKAGLDKTLRNFGDLDLQGRSFLHMLGRPRVVPMLFYLFLLYLSANP
jgi:flavin-dependent dehydrogenase